MSKTRTFIAALCGVAIAAPAFAAGCLRPEERDALDVRALRTYLMVSALQCRQAEPYNRFVRQFGGQLSSADRAASAHFTRTYGGQGRTRLDSFNTSLANEHSQDAVRAGSFFCTDATALFQQALAIPPSDLAKFAVQRNIPVSYDAEDCGAAPARATHARATRSARRR